MRVHTRSILVQRLEQRRRVDAEGLKHILCLAIQLTQPESLSGDAALPKLPNIRERGAHGVGVRDLVSEHS